MSEEHSAGELSETSGSTDSVNRRRFVKALGTTAALGIFGVSGVQAQPGNGDHPVTKLSGDKAQRIFQSLSNEPEYNQLKERVTERGEQLCPEDMTVIRVDGEKEAVLVDVPITKTDAKKAYLCIGRDEKTDDIIAAALEYKSDVADRKKEIKKMELDPENHTSSFKETIQTVDPKPNHALSEQDAYEVTPQASFGCGVCKAAVSVILRVGCNESGFLVCTAIGLAGIELGAAPAAGCEAFVSVACETIERAGAGVKPKVVCTARQLGSPC